MNLEQAVEQFKQRILNTDEIEDLNNIRAEIDKYKPKFDRPTKGYLFEFIFEKKYGITRGKR